MNDSKLLQGLLIAACAFLGLGIILTTLDIQDYKNVASAPTAARPVAPPPQVDEPEPDTPVEAEADTPTDAE